MDVYQILMQDHRAIDRIFADIEQTDGTTERRERLFEKLRVALEGHTVIEENLFYPEIDKSQDLKELGAEAYDEHATFDEILREISELSTNKTEWMERIRELGGAVQEHLRKEEDKMFPAARQELDRGAQKNLEDKSQR